jgi:hypothetical protein
MSIELIRNNLLSKDLPAPLGPSDFHEKYMEALAAARTPLPATVDPVTGRPAAADPAKFDPDHVQPAIAGVDVGGRRVCMHWLSLPRANSLVWA